MSDNILNKNIDSMIQLQKESNKIFRSFQYRKRLIQSLLNWIIDNENIIKGAIKADLKKPNIEIELTETWFCVKEARYILKNLKCWMRKEKVSKTLSLITPK